MLKLCNGEWCSLWVVNHYKTPKRCRKHIISLIEKGLIIRVTHRNGFTSLSAQMANWRKWGTGEPEYLVTKKGDFYLQRDQGRWLKQLAQSQESGTRRIARKMWPKAYIDSLKARQHERIFGPTLPDYSGVVDAFYRHAEECEAAGYAMAA